MACHGLALSLACTLSTIDAMPVDEFRAWLAYFQIVNEKRN